MRRFLPTGHFYAYTTKGMGRRDVPMIVRLIEVTEGKGTSQDFDFEIKWHAAESAVDEFNRGLSRILASAKEQAPLMSLLAGHYLPSALVTRVDLTRRRFLLNHHGWAVDNRQPSRLTTDLRLSS